MMYLKFKKESSLLVVSSAYLVYVHRNTAKNEGFFTLHAMHLNVLAHTRKTQSENQLTRAKMLKIVVQIYYLNGLISKLQKIEEITEPLN